MSHPTGTDSKELKQLNSAESGKVQPELQPRRNKKPDESGPKGGV